MPVKIDAHVHYTPPSMAENLEAFSEKEPYWGLLLTPDPVNPTQQGWASGERMIADMDRAGIDKVVLLGVYRQTLENTRDTNNDTLELMRRWPDRVCGFAVVTPRPVEKGLDELKRCLDAGMLGVGEMNPYGQRSSFEDPGFLRIVEACIEYDIPLNLHVSEEVGHFYLGKTPTPLLQYYHLACQYPELKLILAHWGGGLFFYEMMPEVRGNLKNVWYDTAGSPLIYPTHSIFKTALELLSPEKILYGSDYPLLIMPDQQQEPDFRPFLSAIEALSLEAEVYADVMGGNSARLLGFEEKKVEEIQLKSEETPKAAAAVTTRIEDSTAAKIDPYVAVRAIAEAWPETRVVFDKYGIPWQAFAVPFWEPLAQVAAACGLGPSARNRLLNDLGDVLAKRASL